MFRRSFWSLIAVSAGLSLSAYSSAQETPFAEGQVLVRFSRGVNDVETAQKLVDARQYVVERVLVPELNLFLVKLKSNQPVGQAVKRLAAANAIRYAQPDHLVTLRETFPDDTDFAKQWSLHNPNHADIKAPDAWDLGKGGLDRDGNDIVVAIVDGGVDLSHKDLKDNIWINKGEIPANSIDDDGNGYVDDVNGWNAYSHNATIPANRHGTHVAGIAGASGNNGLGIAGVNWQVKIMSVAASSGKTSVISEGYGYVLKQKKLWLETNGQKGANVVVTNSSFGVDLADCSKGEYPVWNDLYEAMGKVGILSAAATANRNIDVDQKGDVPTGCSSQYIVKVTNTDSQDKKNSGAAFGLKSIELGAPGTAIHSLLPGDTAGSLTGTSMATPHVAGAIAFLHSVASSDFHNLMKRDPGAASAVVKHILLENVDKIPSLEGITVSGGRLNLSAAAHAIHEYKETSR